MTCPPFAHNRLSATYDGRMEITRRFPGGHEERCSVCGKSYIQVYARDVETVNTEPEWHVRSQACRMGVKP